MHRKTRRCRSFLHNLSQKTPASNRGPYVMWRMQFNSPSSSSSSMNPIKTWKNPEKSNLREKKNILMLSGTERFIASQHMCDDPSAEKKKKVYWEITRCSGPRMQIDSVSGVGSKSWVVISRGLDRHVKEISAERKLRVFPETATREATSSISRNRYRMWFLHQDQRSNRHQREVRNQVLFQ